MCIASRYKIIYTHIKITYHKQPHLLKLKKLILLGCIVCFSIRTNKCWLVVNNFSSFFGSSICVVLHISQNPKHWDTHTKSSYWVKGSLLLKNKDYKIWKIKFIIYLLQMPFPQEFDVNFITNYSEREKM